MLVETTLTRELADRRAADGSWAGTRLQQALERAVEAGPDRVAAVDARGRLTWGELAEQADAAALALLGLGVRRGDVVVVQLPNWNEFVVLMLAVERIGAVLNPVAPIFRHHELRSMLRLARPVVAVVAGEFRGFSYASLWADLLEENETVRHLAFVGNEPAGGLAWAELLARGRSGPWDRSVLDLLAPHPDDVAELIFTSGTTGEPKGVMHTHNTLEAGVRLMIDAQAVGPGDVVHMASTFAHQTGYLFGARLFVQAGATGVFQDVWDPSVFADLVGRERVTASFGATPFLADVLRVPALDERDLSSWRVFGCFGAPIPLPLLEQAAERLPCRVMPGWGMSEVGLVTTTRPSDPPAKTVTTDGAPFPGCDVMVIDEEGREAAPGEEGDLVCQSVAGFVGYVQGRAVTEACYTADGWFTTGDRARMDDEGFIRITGRTKDLIIRGGENVPVKEIEDVLVRHPRVAGVAVVAVPDDRLGEIGCACVLADGTPPSFEDLKDLLRQARVTPQFWPERLELVDGFPTTPSGKVQKYKLREMLSARPPGGRGGSG